MWKRKLALHGKHEVHAQHCDLWCCNAGQRRFFPLSCWQWSYPVIHCQGRHIGEPEGTLWTKAEQISWRFKENISTFGPASECSARYYGGQAVTNWLEIGKGLWRPGQRYPPMEAAATWMLPFFAMCICESSVARTCNTGLACAHSMFTRNAGNADFYGKCPT